MAQYSLAALLLFSICAVATATAQGPALDALSRRQRFGPRDFFVNVASLEPGGGPGVELRPAFVNTAPILHGAGVSLVQFDLAPCAVNAAHIHPRGTEILYMQSGDKVRIGIAEEDGGRTIERAITPGMAAIFPESLLHYQQNLGCAPVRFIAAFSSEDAGTLSFPERLLSFDDDILSTTFGISKRAVRSLQQSARMMKDQRECFARCRL